MCPEKSRNMATMKKYPVYRPEKAQNSGTKQGPVRTCDPGHQFLEIQRKLRKIQRKIDIDFVLVIFF